MESFNKYLRYILIVMMFFITNSCRKKMQFYAFNPLSKVIKNDHRVAKGDSMRFDFFAIKNYNVHDPENIAVIDSFALHHIPENVRNYSHFSILFFKYNSAINDDFSKIDYQDLLEMQYDYYLYKYKWENGVFKEKIDVKKRDAEIENDTIDVEIFEPK